MLRGSISAMKDVMDSILENDSSKELEWIAPVQEVFAITKDKDKA